MNEEVINTRIQNKHDTEENWLKAINFIPLQGELIIYDVDDNYSYERFKIGDGVTNVNLLPFRDPDTVLSSMVSSALGLGSLELTDVSPIAHNISCRVESKNLLNGNLREEEKTEKGVTIRYLPEEDCYLFDGTSDTFGTFYSLDTLLEVNDYITLSTNVISGSVTKPEGKFCVFYCGYADPHEAASGNWVDINITENADNTSTTAKKYLRKTWFYMDEGVAFDNYKVKIQVEKGTAKTPYTLYVDIGAEVDGAVGGTVTRYGKNLLNGDLRKTAQMEKGVTIQYLPEEDCYLFNGTSNTWGAFYRLETLLVINGKITLSTYVISGSVSGTEGKHCVFYCGSVDNPDDKSSNWVAASIVAQTVSTSDTRKYLYDTWFFMDAGITFENYKVKVQIELGADDTAYEPYVSPVEYAPSTNGEIVGGISSLSPTMNLFSDEGTIINVEYYNNNFNEGLGLLASTQAGLNNVLKNTNNVLENTNNILENIVNGSVSVPKAQYANEAEQASQIPSRNIELSDGVKSIPKAFNGTGDISIPVTDISEAYLTWGGKNFSDGFGPIDAAMIPQLGANRLAFFPSQRVTLKYSKDGGVTWLDLEDDGTKRNLFVPGALANFTIGNNDHNQNINPYQYQCRVILKFDNNIASSGPSLYTILNKIAIYVSTEGSYGCYCIIDGRKENSSEWIDIVNRASINGWSGWNIINTGNIITYGGDPNQASTQYGEIRLTFGVQSHSPSYLNYRGLTIQNIMAFGGVGWATPSNMAATGHIYQMDSYQNVTFPANITAPAFIGTASNASQLGGTPAEDFNLIHNADGGIPYFKVGNTKRYITGDGYIQVEAANDIGVEDTHDNEGIRFTLNTNTLVNKSNSPSIVYGTDSNGNQTNWKLKTSSQANTIPLRNENGNISGPDQITTPPTDNQYTIKAYNDNTYLEKKPQYSMSGVYGFTNTGARADRPLIDKARWTAPDLDFNGGIPEYGWNGNASVLYTGTPTNNFECANKIYADYMRPIRHHLKFSGISSDDSISVEFYHILYTQGERPLTQADIQNIFYSGQEYPASGRASISSTPNIIYGFSISPNRANIILKTYPQMTDAEIEIANLTVTDQVSRVAL